MKRFMFPLIVVQLIAIALHAQVPNPELTYPLDAHLVPASKASNLQRELDKHKRVILEPHEYGVDVRIKSDYEIYGLPGTELKNVIVEGGTRHAVVSGVKCSSLKFPESQAVTRENLFHDIRASLINISEARLENNHFVYLFCKVIISTKSTGYLRNNRFIRTTVHSHIPQLYMKGNDTHPSYGNVFLWFNFLNGREENAVIENQKSLTIAGVDAEYYSNGYTLFDVKNVDKLTLMGVSGGDNEADNVPLARINAKKSIIYGMNIKSKDKGTHIQVGKETQSFAMVNSNDYNMKFDNRNTDYADAFKSDNGVLFNGKNASKLSGQEKSKLNDAMSFPEGRAWEVYEHDTRIPKRRPDSAVINDHTAYLQRLIDKKGIVFLEEGVYYISKPLELERHQALIGRGKGVTVIRALGNINMIVNQRKKNGKIIERPRFNITQLSLENGKNGIYYSIEEDGGRSVFIASGFLSNIEFYNMSHAGFHLDYSQCKGLAFDNNLLDRLDFFKCTYGVKQTNACDCHKWPCPYVDKTAFYRCRFIDNKVGVDLTARRQNTNNAWIECLFKDNKEIDLTLQNNANPLFALCRFESPYADKIIENAMRPLVLSSIINSGKSGASIFPGNSFIDGVTIKANNAKLFGNSKYSSSLSNSTISGTVSIGNVDEAILYNNRFDGNQALNKRLVKFVNGKRITILNEDSSPAPGILHDEYNYDNDCNDKKAILDKPKIVLKETSLCEGETIELRASSEFQYYQWSTGETSSRIKVASNKSISLKVANCPNQWSERSEIFDVVFKDKPAKPKISNSGTAEICSENPVKLSAPAGFAAYEWHNSGATNASIEVDKTGEYSVKIKSKDGCWSEFSDPVKITAYQTPDPPVINFDGNKTLCNGENITLVAKNNYDAYLWSDNSGQSKLVVNQAGNYSLKVANGDCWSKSSAEVAIKNVETPGKPVLDYKGSLSLCEGEVIDLKPAQDYNFYQWSNGDASPSVKISSSQSIHLKVANCKGQWSQLSKSLTFKFTPKPSKPVLTASGQLQLCDDEELEISVVGDFEYYKWSNGKQKKSFFLKEPGKYSVQVSNCSNEKGWSSPSDDLDLEIVESPEVTEVLVEGDSLYVHGYNNHEFQWYLDDLAILGSGENYIVPTVEGNYKVEIINQNGCKTFSHNYRFISQNKYFIVFPNPSDGRFRIKLKDPQFTSGQVTISNFDDTKSMVYEFDDLINQVIPIDFDVSHFNSGLFLIKIESGNQLMNGKLVIN